MKIFIIERKIINELRKNCRDLDESIKDEEEYMNEFGLPIIDI